MAVVVSMLLAWLSAVAFTAGSVALEAAASVWQTNGLLEVFAMSVLALFFTGFFGVMAVLGPGGTSYVLPKDAGIAVAAAVLTLLASALAAFGYSISLKLGARIVVRLRPEARKWSAAPAEEVKEWALLCLFVCVASLALTVVVDKIVQGASPFAVSGALCASWFVGALGVWGVTRRLRQTRPPQSTIQSGSAQPVRHRRRHATHGSALAAFAVVLAGFISAGTVAGSAQRRLLPAATGRITSVAAAGTARLAVEFEPRLYFSSNEKWFPTTVRWFLSHSRKDSGGSPSWCNAEQPCRVLTCPTGTDHGCCDQSDGRCAPSGLGKPNLYWVVPPNPPADTARESRQTLLIQYWFFYNFDSLGTLARNALTQWHQSDWEEVTVGLIRHNRDVSPSFVAFSEHCGGTVLPWTRVPTSNATHPVDYVAHGSHANYPRRFNAPVRQLTCSLAASPSPWYGAGTLFFQSLFHGSDLEVPLDYMVGIRDQTGTKNIGDLPLRPLPKSSVLEYPGHWGRDNNLSIAGISHHRLSSPASPGCQAPFYDALTVFCNGKPTTPYQFCASHTRRPCPS